MSKINNKVKTVRMTEDDCKTIVERITMRILKEHKQGKFEQEYNKARDNFKGSCWGFEMKNKDGDWEYGDIKFNPQSMTMWCMGASITVDPTLSVQQNLEALYDELINNGYNND